MVQNNFFIIQIMKKVFLNILIVFSFCSCANDDAGFDSNSKKKIMESWAWKIFIFTDEGEFTPVETAKNKFENTTKVSPIFVEDVLEIYSNDDFFLNNKKETFNDPIVYAKFNLAKRKQ
jgi:hypothetical protein